MNEIQYLKFNGIEFDKMHSGYWNLNALTYTQEPTRVADGTIPDINNIETFYVPRLWVDFKMLTLAEYQELMAVINTPSFDIEYFDAEKNEFVVNNFYLSPLERNELYSRGANIVGVENFNLEFIGTLNEPTSELSLFEMTIALPYARTFRLGEGYSSTFAYYINWGDNSAVQYVSKTNGAITTLDTYYTEHTYATAGTYKIQIFGVFPYIYIAQPYNFYITAINNWGTTTIGNILGVKSFFGNGSGCPNLLTLPNDDASNKNTEIVIPNYAYSRCSGLKNVIINSNVGECSFAICTSLESVVFEKNNATSYGCYSIGVSAFSGCSKLTTVDFSNANYLIYIYDFAFYDCDLNNIIIYTTDIGQSDHPIMEIGQNAFSGNANLTKFTLYKETPPTLGIGIFANTGITESTGNIYVPYASVSDYKATTKWSDFATQISAITNTVTLNGNGGTISAGANWTGSGATATKTVTYTLAVGTIPTSSEIAYTGYTFGGWNTASDGTGTTYTNATLYQVKGDLTLYAKWTAV